MVMGPEFQMGESANSADIDRLHLTSHEQNSPGQDFLNKKMSEEVWHEGGCHCGAVKFRVLEKTTLTVVKCK